MNLPREKSFSRATLAGQQDWRVRHGGSFCRLDKFPHIPAAGSGGMVDSSASFLSAVLK